METEISIPAIKDGTVIDHIPSRQTLRIFRILDPQEFEHTVSLALNLKSKRVDKKGVIKINDRNLTADEVNKIALLAPQATVNIIKDYKVIKKVHVTLPDCIEKIVKCANANCITNHEQVGTRFIVEDKASLRLRCSYCERTMRREDIKLK